MPRFISAAVIGAIALAVQAQSPLDTPTPKPGTGSISGRVVEAETGDPVRKARVTVETDVGHVPPVLSGADGRFVITGLVPGKYALTAAKPGFAKTMFGQQEGVALPARLSVGVAAHVEGIEVRLLRAAAISGRVIDAGGEPVVMASVTAEIADGRQVKQAASRQTDDSGEYRLGGLSAGTYLVS